MGRGRERMKQREATRALIGNVVHTMHSDAMPSVVL